jgi:hypothetical protein
VDSKKKIFVWAHFLVFPHPTHKCALNSYQLNKPLTHLPEKCEQLFQLMALSVHAEPNNCHHNSRKAFSIQHRKDACLQRSAFDLPTTGEVGFRQAANIEEAEKKCE